MTPVLQDAYELNLANRGKLELRAKRLLADDTPESVFEACVLFHQAARIQRVAVDGLAERPLVTVLASAVEECWCYVEGRDPPRAAEAWGDVLHARVGVDPKTADSICSRIAPRFEASRREFACSVSSSPTLLALRDAGRIAGLMRTERTKARKELARVLERFPGTTSFWWMQYRLAEADGEKDEAWSALTKARRLAPENPRYLAMSLLVATWALPVDAAERHLAGERGSLDRAGAEVCLMYALAEITLARGASSASERKARWARARDAADRGLLRAETEGLSTNLRAVQLLARELLAGREPTMDILYLAGLGEAAARAKPDTDVVDYLAEELRAAA